MEECTHELKLLHKTGNVGCSGFNIVDAWRRTRPNQEGSEVVFVDAAVDLYPAPKLGSRDHVPNRHTAKHTSDIWKRGFPYCFTHFVNVEVFFNYCFSTKCKTTVQKRLR